MKGFFWREALFYAGCIAIFAAIVFCIAVEHGEDMDACLADGRPAYECKAIIRGAMP